MKDRTQDRDCWRAERVGHARDVESPKDDAVRPPHLAVRHDDASSTRGVGEAQHVEGEHGVGCQEEREA